jgi:uncharacterized protein YciI
MKAYVIYCRDRPETENLRKKATPAHLKHVEDHLDQHLVAGPMKDADGNTVGSLLIVKAVDADDARGFIERDPYFSPGFWESIQIFEFIPAAGDWIGGKIW